MRCAHNTTIAQLFLVTKVICAVVNRFKCDKLIFMPSIGVHGVSTGTNGAKFTVSVKILKESRTSTDAATLLKSNAVDFRASPKFNLTAPIPFRFDSPVAIVPHCFHILQVTTTVNNFGPLNCTSVLRESRL